MAKLKRHVDPIYLDDGSGYVIPKVGSKDIQTYEPKKKPEENSSNVPLPVQYQQTKKTAATISSKNIDNNIHTPDNQPIDKPHTETHLPPDSSLEIKKADFTLIICEKPQAAMKIAYSLADISPTKKNFYGVPYWELAINEKKYVIASAVGHLYGLRQKSSSKEWPTFDLEWDEKEGFSRKYVTAMKTISKGASDYILACDYDVEGEVIGFNALRFICHTETARRMKFSALTKFDLQKSFQDIEPTINYGQAYAGETRHYLDWFYGINLSRALIESVKSVGAFKILSIGRVQGPALAMIVELEKRIQEFKPTPYWQVFLLVEDEKGQRVEVKFPENITSEEEAEKFLKLKGKKGQAITEINNQSLRPFPAFDLTSLQMESYKLFRFSPAQTLALAQKLYLAGLISYPRTSSQKLPPTIGYRRILEKLKKNFPKLAEELSRERPVEGGKTDPAHPAIFPTGEYSLKLAQDEKKVYELIVKRFLACFSNDALIENKKLKVNAEEKEFFADGKKILEQGWLKIYPYKIQENDIPTMNGQVTIQEARTEQKMTEPPRRYSPASIILELERRKLGTKTTRAMIIDTLYKRGYVQGTQIQATSLGIATVDTLNKNSPTILDEQLTRKFEEEMEKIQEEKSPEKIKQEENDILEEAKKIIIKISKEFKEKEKEIGLALISASKEQEIQKTESSKLFPCPECKKGDLIMKRSMRGKRYAACDNEPCSKTYALPQFGMIKASDRRCEKCGRQMPVLIKKSRPPWYFCMNPGCWQKDAADKAAKKEAKFKEREEKVLLKKKEQKEKIKAKQTAIKKKLKEKEKAKKLKEKLLKKGAEKKAKETI